MAAPVVFVSYSHDSPEHKAWVLRLATNLRASGIDARLDQWDLVPGQDMATFMHDGVAQADRVLLVCTERYVAKANSGSGGVGYERLIVTAEIVEAIETKKFIPIVRNNPGPNKVPGHLGPRLHIDFSRDDEYPAQLEALCREILGVPANPKPPLGVNPFSATAPTIALPPRAVGPTGATPGGEPVVNGTWFSANRAAASRGLADLQLPGWMELRVAPHESLRKSQMELLTAVRASQIKTFGWPIGIVLDGNDEFRPRPFKDGIRAEVKLAKDAMLGRPSYDFWSLATNGDFYLLQSLFEDARAKDVVYFNTRIVRVAESLMFVGRLYEQLGAAPETRYTVRVSHEGLAGRILSSAGGRRLVRPTKCLENGIETEITVVLQSHKQTLASDVRHLLSPLFMLFEFTDFAESIYEDIVRKFEAGDAT